MRQMLKVLQRNLTSHLDELERRSVPEESLASSNEGHGTKLAAKLMAVTERIRLRFPQASIAMYGSQVRGGADEFSDLDVLVALSDRSAPASRRRFVLDGIPIDMTLAGAKSFHKILLLRHKHNNNWLLNALCFCLVDQDSSRELSMLIRLAGEISRKGPSLYSETEIREGLSELDIRLRSARLLSQRSAISEKAKVPARIRADQSVTTAIYLFYCVRGLWTTSLPRLLERSEREFPELYGLWIRYTLAKDTDEAVEIAAMIIKSVRPLATPLGNVGIDWE